ncbi:response regulator [Methylophaga sp. OBS4]|uniref:response regulator n=1 Tax=Methylophaga sp. OBS4 TaxID=2991935 RepID=UPI00224D0BCE|nr:response regulator transcription factor [Methylophaga sp. OBS4]MCX4186891.1 response regulator transcription factor [Methylophaga sp. OBS4]
MITTTESILVVEDEAQIRKFLRISLEAQGYKVHEARRGTEGLEIAARCNPNLIILDLGLPDIDGQDFILELRKWSQTPVIVLSVRADEMEKVQALDAGVNDYVTKPFGISELMARVRAILRSSEEVTPTRTEFEFQGLVVNIPNHEITLDGHIVNLSKKEFELLRLLITHSGHILTHNQILREIWGDNHLGQTHYLRVLVGHLRQKLNDDPINPRFIKTIQGIGYRLA